MFRKFLFVFTLSALATSGHVAGQELLRTVLPVDYTITVRTFPKESPARQMLGSLAMNSGINLYQVKIEWQSYVFVSIKRDGKGLLTVNLKLLYQQLSGSTYFRDFALDSLLLPLSVNGTLSIQSEAGQSAGLAVKLFTSGEWTVVELPGDLLLKPNSFQLGLTIEQAQYDKQSELAFTQASTLVNLYYAYNEILKELIAESDARVLNRNPGAAEVFLAWHRISRVNNYIGQHDFVRKLHLEKNDPQGFLQHLSTVQRMEKRAATLFRQTLNTEKKGNLSGRDKYCAGYAKLSQKYLRRANQLQPYLAGGFEEMAQINPTVEEKKKLSEVAAFYDVPDNLEKAATPQLVYTQFVNLAQQAFDKNQFVASLQMLQNAAQIEEWFETVVVSETSSMLYNQSLDGVMTSYLKVAIIAYKSGKSEMADKYYQKALMDFQHYGSPLFEGKAGEQYLPHFTKQQIKLSQDLLADGQWLKTLALLNQAGKVQKCKSFVSPVCSQIDSLMSVAHRGIFKMKIDLVDKWLAREKYDSAAVALDSTKKYTEYFHSYFRPNPNGEFEGRAEPIFRSFFLRGVVLLNGRQPGKALSYFLKAREVEKEYLPTRDSLLQTLVYNATVPVILSKIDKASFETWANRMDSADSLYREARQMQSDYRQQNNAELNTAFLALEMKMEQHGCMTINYQIINLNDLAENAVRAGKFDKAEIFLQEAGTLLSSREKCNPDSTKTILLRTKYAGLFEYMHRFKQIEIHIDELKYDSVIAQLVSLNAFYLQQQLEKFGVEKPSLDEYVAEKGIHELSKAAILFFVRDDDFMRALHFLNDLKEQQVSAWEAREVQQIVGKGIGQIDVDQETEKQVLKYTGGDNWYIYFKLARLSAKVLK